jgi:NAD(P)-dependent dehydrogenase (short-subunit alcohol dehydrogenase family)
MQIEGTTALVTGAASGLGRATAQRLVDGGAKVVLVDRDASAGEAAARQLGGAVFREADVTDPDAMAAAVDATSELGELRVLVHCAGRGGPVRTVARDGGPGSLEEYAAIVTINLIGSFNVLRLAAARMADNEPLDGDRGVCVLTASAAAFEGQIGQVAYASSKAGILGLTFTGARDLSSRQIRVCSIAPGVFDTPILSRLTEEQRAALGASVPHPSRLGAPDEFARMAVAIVENPMLNGETIRLDGALRMAPR